MLRDSVKHCPYKFKSEITIKDTEDVTDIRREERLKDLKGDDKLRYDSDIKDVNILLLGLPVDIYTLINHYETANEIWDRVKELIEGIEITKQERKSMLYDEFEKFTSEPGESIYSYYLRYAKLINDMNINIYDTYANQHKICESSSIRVKDVKEVREMRQPFPKPLALLANTYNPPPSYRVKDSGWFKEKMLLAQAQEENFKEKSNRFS
ncbi:hypothetical protein Tco_0340192 [Tanacetum coccineum]